MKIALCLSGFIGNVDKWIKGEEIDYNYGYKYIKEAILNGYDVDVFIHSWSVPHESGLKKRYSPVKSIFEQNKNFKLRNVVSKDELPTPYSFAVKSMWYSRKKAVELVIEHEKQNEMKYDFVLLTRFDIALFKKFEFESYDSSKVYLAGPVMLAKLRSGKVIPHKINDMYFMSNSENMEKVVKIADTYEEIAVSQNNKWPMESVSSHIIITKHFLNEGLFDNVKVLFERPWQSSTAWSGDIRFLRSDPNLKTIKL